MNYLRYNFKYEKNSEIKFPIETDDFTDEVNSILNLTDELVQNIICTEENTVSKNN